MEIVRRLDGREDDVLIRVNSGDATLADLAAGLGGELEGSARLFVDGRALRSDTDLSGSGLCRGSVVSAAPDEAEAGQPDGAALQLCVIGGLDAGHVEVLASGTHTLGRDEQSDIVIPEPSVSRRHCQLAVEAGTVTVSDLGSSGGTWVDGNRLRAGATETLAPSSVVETGAVAFVVRPRRADDRSMAVDPMRFAGETGEIPFNRPPRPAAAPEPRPLRPPKAPALQDKPRFNPIATLAPAVAGIVMAFALHQLLYLMMAGLTPLMAVVNWADNRRQAGRKIRVGDHAYRAELEDFSRQVRQVTAAERQRREAAHPDLPEVLRRATLPSVRLWERRAGNPDYLHLSLAHGPLRWDVPLDEREYASSLAPEVAEIVEAGCTLQQVPITADLAAGGPIGIVGDRENVLALARSLLCQAAVLHGPSDMPTIVLVDDDRVAAWDWVKWLPHVRDLQAGDERLLLSGEKACNRLVQAILDAAGGREGGARGERAQRLFVVVDSDNLTRGKQAPVRDLLKGNRVPATGIVIAPSEDLLPASCTTVVECHDVPGEVTITRPQEGATFSHVVLAGLSDERARGCARALARFEDPEIKVPGATLPKTVRTSALLGDEVFDREAVRRRWRAYGEEVGELFAEDHEAKPPMEAAIGRTESSPLMLDIVGDGPHGLVGGTTGSGKTELLRSIVLGLAASAGPRYLNFIFIDFKGGAGFETLSQLPHCVGLATNLNSELTERLLVCLQAELDYRQRRFREAPVPVDELHKYWSAGTDPLPRLLVVVDELAELVAAVPDFTSGLIRIGRIGRTLGVHLLLATQRPGGVITQELRENTNYAIALRVRDASNSLDIVGVPDAASIPPRNATGRAYLRVGGADGSAPTLFQSGYSSAATRTEAKSQVEVAPFAFGRSPESAFAAASPASTGSAPAGGVGPTDLERIVDTMVSAFAESGEAAPRRPFADPLPQEISLDDLVPPLPAPAAAPAAAPVAAPAAAPRPEVVPLALGDDLADQSQHPYGWELRRGNILFYGVVGSGTTNALASVALAVDRLFAHGSAEVYVLDCGAGELVELESLASVGAVVTSTETERQVRLAHRFLDELRQRKASPRIASERPAMFLLIDSFAGLTTAAEEAGDLLEVLQRVFSEGPDVGIWVAASADRPQAVPYRLADVAPQKWVMRLSEAADYVTFGLGRHAPAAVPPGRAFIAGTGIAVQIGRALPDIPGAVAGQAARAPAGVAKPPPIGTLPGSVPISDLAGSLVLSGETWHLPVGIGNTTLDPYCLVLHRAEHAVVAGPARSGKSSLLRALALLATEAAPECTVLVLLGRPASPLADGTPAKVLGSEEELVAAVTEAAGRGPVLALVDDAHLVTDPMGQLEQLLSQSDPNVHLVAAGRTDELRQAFGHWTQTVRKSRAGVVLKVSQPGDGDVIGANLPFARSYDTRPGRGYAANDGELELVQVTFAEGE